MSPVEDALRLVAQRFAEAFDPIFLRLYYHSALEDHALAEAFYDQFVSRFIGLVEQLIERGIREGSFRKVDRSDRGASLHRNAAELLSYQ